MMVKNVLMIVRVMEYAEMAGVCAIMGTRKLIVHSKCSAIKIALDKVFAQLLADVNVTQATLAQSVKFIFPAPTIVLTPNKVYV